MANKATSTFYFKITIAALVCLVFTSFLPDPPYPKDYFRAPIGGAVVLSGSFGELRNSHFHTGLDIKPVQLGQEGDPVYAAADGFVSRIVASATGYGKGLYVAHPNGFTTVYGHLDRFRVDIANFVKAQQYADKRFEQNIDTLRATRFPVKKGELIGYMGNTGSSQGVHLHFEIRDTKTENPLNPLLFGIKVADAVPPLLQELKVYALDSDLRERDGKRYPVAKNKAGAFVVADTIYTSSELTGLGIKAFDKMSGADNTNGVFALECYADDSLVYRFEVAAMDFDERRYINAHLDYAVKHNGGGWIQRLFLLAGNNNATNYPRTVERGVLRVGTKDSRRVRIIAHDYAGNRSELRFVLARRGAVADRPRSFNYLLPLDEPSILPQGDAELSFEAFSFYEKMHFRFYTSTDKSADMFSDMLHIHYPDVPVHKPFKISILPYQKLNDALAPKAFIAQCTGNKVAALPSRWEGDRLTANAGVFGDYCVMIDTFAPTITLLPTATPASKGSEIAFRIADKLTGVADYRGEIDGLWVLFEYDAKSGTLVHVFERDLPPGNHRLRVMVVDAVGNEAVIEQAFVR